MAGAPRAQQPPRPAHHQRRPVPVRHFRARFAPYPRHRLNGPGDVGFGDALPSGPTELDYPTLLDTPPPNVLAYSLETVIAEKLQAATVLYEVNSRYKDFYDTHQLAISQALEAQDLHRAIEATFNRRGRAIPEAHRLFAPAFTDDQGRQAQWSAFLKRIRQTSPDSFPDLMKDISAFIGPILNGAKKGSWNPAEGAWTNAEST